MKDEKPAVPEVNLLPGDDLEGRPGGIFLQWALTWGKRIVVITELIVILAFLSRFWLDTEVANLAESINQKKLLVQSESDFEQRFRSLAQRIDRAKAVELITSPLTVFDAAQPLIPSTVAVANSTVDGKSISFSASSDEASLGKMVDQFKTSSIFDSVSVEGVSRTGTSGNVNFSLHASYVNPTP